ncbi:helix-turn-helix domain-containing protein [Phenylobacterium sp.]|uniref:helix-turn-helix domain-containing protein n=1 Tax=Phenylobacterium sp. TaxID=1871053 RepID=UPI00374D0980
MAECELDGVGQVMQVIGKRLRSRRRLLGLSQMSLGQTCGVTFQQIQKYESGAVAISASRLWKLANALGVSIGYFFDGVSSRGHELAGHQLVGDEFASLAEDAR